MVYPGWNGGYSRLPSVYSYLPTHVAPPFHPQSLFRAAQKAVRINQVLQNDSDSDGGSGSGGEDAVADIRRSTPGARAADVVNSDSDSDSGIDDGPLHRPDDDDGPREASGRAAGARARAEVADAGADGPCAVAGLFSDDGSLCSTPVESEDEV